MNNSKPRRNIKVKCEINYDETNQVKMAKKPIGSTAEKSRRHKCEECGKAFLSKNDLRKHGLTHSGLKPHVCSHCQKEFSQAGNLKNHIASHHSDAIKNPTVYNCEYCDKEFLIKERLQLHMRTHTGEKPYGCETCSMSFARLSQVHQHRRTHKEEKDYICQHCQATFNAADKLQYHIKGHLDIRDYSCHLCDKCFIRPDNLKQHIAYFHNGERRILTCPVCNKSLKGNLRDHLRTHEGEKPHKCEDCGKSFTQRSNLTAHRRSHSKQRIPNK